MHIVGLLVVGDVIRGLVYGVNFKVIEAGRANVAQVKMNGLLLGDVGVLDTRAVVAGSISVVRLVLVGVVRVVIGGVDLLLVVVVMTLLLSEGIL